jgi:hypothetical protein
MRSGWAPGYLAVTPRADRSGIRTGIGWCLTDSAAVHHLAG